MATTYGMSYFSGYRFSPFLECFLEDCISAISDYLTAHREGDAVTILDVGCAFGWFLGMCDQRGWQTWGMDISEFALAHASDHTRAVLHVQDVQEGIPFESRFDAVTCFEVVEHLVDPRIALAHIHDALRLNGLFVLTTPNPRSYFYRRIFTRWQDPDETHISIKTPSVWIRLLGQAGFEIVRCWTEYPIASRRGGTGAWVAKILGYTGLGSTLCVMATKDR